MPVSVRKLSCIAQVFASDSDGNVAVISALAALPIMAFAGMAIDLRHTSNSTREVQVALDSAVLAGARALRQGEEIETVRADIGAFMTMLGDTTRRGLSCSGSTPDIPDTLNSIYVRYDCRQDTTVSQVAGQKYLDFVVETKVRFGSEKDGCVLALGPDVPTGISVSGSGTIQTDNCAVLSNVRGEDSIEVSGSGYIESSCVHAAGGITGSDQITTTECATPVPNDGVTRDPYSDIEITENVSAMSCEKEVSTGKFDSYLPSGRYCTKDIKINGYTELEEGGVFYFDGIDIDMHSSSSFLYGRDVTIIFMNDAQFKNANGGTVDLTAKTDGDWAGILMYGDRDTTSPYASMKITGNSASILQGALYFPEHDIEYRGGATTSDGCTQIVSRSVDFSGNASIASNCEDLGVRKFGPPREIFLAL